MNILQVAKLSKYATIPSRGSAESAGFDLYSAYEYTVPPYGNTTIFTDWQIKLPEGCYGRVAPRSALEFQENII